MKFRYIVKSISLLMMPQPWKQRKNLNHSLRIDLLELKTNVKEEISLINLGYLSSVAHNLTHVRFTSDIKECL